MKNQLLPHLQVETKPNPDASVIWLHGLGADGHDFQPIVPQLRLLVSAAVRFIFPHAPAIPVTINGGAVMPAWYDILDMSIDRKVDELQLLNSASAIVDFIEQEISSGIPPERIVIAGFSQGGAVAFEVALRFPRRLAGLLAMSTYFATKNSISFSQENSQIPIEIHHGDFDPVVPVQLGRESHKILSGKGYDTHLKTYPMEHAVCPQQTLDIGSWLSRVLDLNS